MLENKPDLVTIHQGPDLNRHAAAQIARKWEFHLTSDFDILKSGFIATSSEKQKLKICCERE